MNSNFFFLILSLEDEVSGRSRNIGANKGRFPQKNGAKNYNLIDSIIVYSKNN